MDLSKKWHEEHKHPDSSRSTLPMFQVCGENMAISKLISDSLAQRRLVVRSDRKPGTPSYEKPAGRLSASASCSPPGWQSSEDRLSEATGGKAYPKGIQLAFHPSLKACIKGS